MRQNRFTATCYGATAKPDPSPNGLTMSSTWYDQDEGEFARDPTVEANARRAQRRDVRASTAYREKARRHEFTDLDVAAIAEETGIFPGCVKRRLMEMGRTVATPPKLAAKKRVVNANRVGMIWGILKEHGPMITSAIAEKLSLQMAAVTSCLRSLAGRHFKRVGSPRRGETVWDVINPNCKPVLNAQRQTLRGTKP